MLKVEKSGITRITVIIKTRHEARHGCLSRLCRSSHENFVLKEALKNAFHVVTMAFKICPRTNHSIWLIHWDLIHDSIFALHLDFSICTFTKS